MHSCGYQYGEFDMAMMAAIMAASGIPPWLDEHGKCVLPASTKWMGQWYCLAHAEILMSETEDD